SNLKPGTSIDQDHFLLYPSYKTGYGIEVGSEPTISVGAVLTDPNGAPITLQAATARCLSDTSVEPVTMFTGRKGQTRAQLKPGRYELRMFDEAWEPVEFEVPDNADGTYNLQQPIVIPRKK